MQKLSHIKSWTHADYKWNIASESDANEKRCCTSSTTESESRPNRTAGIRNRRRSRIAKIKSGRNWCNCHYIKTTTLWTLTTCILIAISAITTTEADQLTTTVRTTVKTVPTNSQIGEYATTTEIPTNGTEATASRHEDWQPVNVTQTQTQPPLKFNRSSDSLLLRLARRFSTGNEVWDGIISECYTKPSFTCFQKNVFTYLNNALDVHDLNVTQRLKFYKNQVLYEMEEKKETETPEEIPHQGRSGDIGDGGEAETPIEEVTNALYGKSIKFAMTHDVELQLPEVMFDGATFRISPRSVEGNGIIAKLELIPKQEVEARLAGKMIMKKIQKFLRSKLILSFLALLLIIKIIKIKLFWLLPLVIGVGAAKKLLLKFLLFLFPALSHLFKLCSYYQQSYHTTKYHHHHHSINHHHTVVPPWHSSIEHHQSVPEIIYTHPPKGHPSAYLHGVPVHESYGPGPGHEHFEGAWENSGPGLGSEYISDINRVAQVDEHNAQYFKPHTTNDAKELHAWGLATATTASTSNIGTQMNAKQSHNHQLQQQRWPPTQQQRPPTTISGGGGLQQRQQQQQQQHGNHQKAQTPSHSNFNPFQSQDKQSIVRPNAVYAQSAPHPVYAAAGQQPQSGLTAAAQIAAQYEPSPSRNNQQQQLQQEQQTLSPELTAQLKEALRIQAEQRLIAQQQKILEHQPFVQDGQPLYPLNYDPFYSPILLKIDKIIEQLGIKDDPCKVRVVCSMYKDPSSYSPHSNFVSAELSRETSELEPVKQTNEAVRRFYRLIQAARDGQDQKDCHALYPQCNIPTK